MDTLRINKEIITEFCRINLSTHTDWTGTRVETKYTCDSVDAFVDKFMEFIEEERNNCLEEEEKLRKAAEVNAKRERAEYERLKAKYEALDKRNEENCVSCVNYRATCPCWKADNPEVKKWLNCEGEYSDLKKACPEWYDEY